MTMESLEYQSFTNQIAIAVLQDVQAESCPGFEPVFGGYLAL